LFLPSGGRRPGGPATAFPRAESAAPLSTDDDDILYRDERTVTTTAPAANDLSPSVYGDTAIVVDGIAPYRSSLHP
jgi:hypothetical protein